MGLLGGVGRASSGTGAARCAGDLGSAGSLRRINRGHAPGGWRAVVTLVMLGHGTALLAGPASIDSQPAGDGTSYKWHLPRGFPTPAVPADNAMSAAKVALGRRLFFEPRLSVTGQHSCASCHEPGRAYTDGRALAIGATGQSLTHSAMSLINVAYNISFGWTKPIQRPGRRLGQRPELQSLESQMLQPLLNEHPVELGLAGRQASVCAVLAADPGYRAAFAQAFPHETSASADAEVGTGAEVGSGAGVGTAAGGGTGAGVGTGVGTGTAAGGGTGAGAGTGAAAGDNAGLASVPVSFENVVKAIAAFERTLIFGDSPFDRYVFGGDHDAISAPAKRGMQLFYSPKAGCGSCHSGFNFNGNWRDSQGDTGKPGFANNGIGDQLMRVPTLRNIALTAPYMHDGRFATLDAVLDHYAHVAELPASDPKIRTFNLSADERADLIAFLHSLTDAEFSGR